MPKKSHRKKRKGPKRTSSSQVLLISPPNSYNLWCKDQYEILQRDNPDLTFGQMSATCGPKWKTLSEEDKRPYVEAYEKAKAKWQEEYDLWYEKMKERKKRKRRERRKKHKKRKHKHSSDSDASDSDSDSDSDSSSSSESDAKSKRKKKKKKKDPNAPKKYLSAYMHFAMDVRPQLRSNFPDLTFGALSKKVGAVWSEMHAEEKLPYEKRSQQDKERWERETEAYNAKKKSVKAPSGSDSD